MKYFFEKQFVFLQINSNCMDHIIYIIYLKCPSLMLFWQKCVGLYYSWVEESWRDHKTLFIFLSLRAFKTSPLIEVMFIWNFKWARTHRLNLMYVMINALISAHDSLIHEVFNQSNQPLQLRLIMNNCMIEHIIQDLAICLKNLDFRIHTVHTHIIVKWTTNP